MRNYASNPIRSLFRGATGLFTTATTVMNPRVSRGLVLQVSLLLFCRAMLETIPLPLTSLVGDTVVPIVLNVFQTSIGLAAISAYLNSDSWFGSLGRRLFAPSDSAFISLYAGLVLILGPVIALAESTVIVFESMKISRDLEQRMDNAATPNEASTWRTIILVVASVTYSFIAFLAAFSYRLTGGENVLPAVIGISTLMYFILAYNSDQSNVMEGGLLALYSAALMLLAALEELDLKKSALTKLFSSIFDAPKPEYRALILVVTTLAALFTLPRAPKLARIVLFSAEVAAAESTPAPRPTNGVPPLGLEDSEISTSSPTPKTHGWKSGLTMAIAVIVVTFRVLVWSGTLRIVYITFLRIEAADTVEHRRIRAKSSQPKTQ